MDVLTTTKPEPYVPVFVPPTTVPDPDRLNVAKTPPLNDVDSSTSKQIRLRSAALIKVQLRQRVVPPTETALAKPRPWTADAVVSCSLSAVVVPSGAAIALALTVMFVLVQDALSAACGAVTLFAMLANHRGQGVRCPSNCA